MERSITIRNKSSSGSQQFLNSFIKSNGIVIIVEKIILNLGDIKFDNRQNIQLSQCIISLFDIMLSGTHDYHQWLFDRLCALAQEIKKLSSDQSKKNNDNQQLISTICEETKNLISAQTLNLMNRRNDIVFRRDNFQQPSQLLDTHHDVDKDPIVPMLSDLDSQLLTISDYFHELRKHDNQIRSTCPTSSESFVNEYNMIKTQLERKISYIESQKDRKSNLLFSTQAQAQELKRQQEESLRPLNDRLRERQNERYQLIQEKERLEQQLEQIKQNLITVDMYIDDTNRDINKLQSQDKTREGDLSQLSTNYQFEIAAFQQQSGCYNVLLKIVNDSYNKLDSWSNNRDQRDSTDRNDIEGNYVNQLAGYLQRLCEAKMEIIARVEHLKEGIEQIKKTNEISSQRYGRTRNIDPHLKKYEQDIIIDENTRKNIEKDIYKHIDRAQKIVTPNFFNNFIDHLLTKTNVGKVIDLSKYQSLNQQQQQQQRSSQPPRAQPRQRPVRNTVSTQTNGGHNNRNQPQQPSRQQNANQPRPRKAPMSKSSQPQQQTRMSGGGSKPPMRTFQNQQNQNNFNNNNNQNNQRPQKRPISNNMSNNQSFGQY